MSHALQANFFYHWTTREAQVPIASSQRGEHHRTLGKAWHVSLQLWKINTHSHWAKLKIGGLKKGGCIRSELFCYLCSKGVGFSEEELFVFPIKCPLCSLSTLLTGPALEGVEQWLSREKKIHQELEDDYSHSPMVGWQAKPEAGWSWVSEFELYWTYFFLFIQQWTRQELSDF